MGFRRPHEHGQVIKKTLTWTSSFIVCPHTCIYIDYSLDSLFIITLFIISLSLALSHTHTHIHAQKCSLLVFFSPLVRYFYCSKKVVIIMMIIILDFLFACLCFFLFILFISTKIQSEFRWMNDNTKIVIYLLTTAVGRRTRQTAKSIGDEG